MANFEKIYAGLLNYCKPLPLNLKLVSPKLKPLLNRLYDAVIKRPIDTESIKHSLVNLLTFLTTSEGKTKDNIWMADLFITFGDWWKVKGVNSLPEPFQYIHGRMMAMNDTLEDPGIAKQFGATPEELLEQAMKL
ncbi:MAG: hypothetical protein WC980_05095 [Candidatus Brocadiia bacterium]